MKKAFLNSLYIKLNCQHRKDLNFELKNFSLEHEHTFKLN